MCLVWGMTRQRNLTMKTLLILLIGLCSTTALFASDKKPIAPKAASCPTGYYRDGGYCMPGKYAKPAIEKRGASCPMGYYSESGYCVKNR